jgi:hypothetical protein
MISPLTRATHTSEIGPLKGMSEMAKAVEAAKPAKESAATFPSYESKVMINWVSEW